MSTTTNTQDTTDRLTAEEAAAAFDAEYPGFMPAPSHDDRHVILYPTDGGDAEIVSGMHFRCMKDLGFEFYMVSANDSLKRPTRVWFEQVR